MDYLEGKSIEELRKSMTEEELIHWAAYYEVKYDREKQEMNRQKAKRMSDYLHKFSLFAPILIARACVKMLIFFTLSIF